ncbi:MAG: tetratricopeptide repeat protein, partial [Planctomycetota bacterium]
PELRERLLDIRTPLVVEDAHGVDEASADVLRFLGRRVAANDGLVVVTARDELAADHPLRLGLHLARLRVARRARGPSGAAALYDPPPSGVGPERARVLAGLAGVEDGDLAGRRELLEFATQHEPEEALWRLAVADVELAAHDLVVDRAGRERQLGDVSGSADSFLEAARNLERAREEAETALGLDPGLSEAHLMLGYVATRLADLASDVEARDEWRRGAEGHYRDALGLDPDSVPAMVNLAENLFYFDEFDQAVRELQAAARLAPAQPLVWSNLGAAHYRTGRIDLAQSAYRESLALVPGDARVRAAYADCVRRAGNLPGAVAELERARRDAGEDRALLAQIAFKLAAIHEHERRYREAVEEYRRHVELGGPDAAKANSRIRALYEETFD